MNALIQAMFMTPELRSRIFNLDPVELGLNLVVFIVCNSIEYLNKTTSSQVAEHEKEKEESTNKGLFEVDEAILKSLVEMGITENHATKALIGTKNGSLDQVFQYIDAHEQDAAFNAEIDPQAAEAAAKKKKRKPRYIPLELQKLFSQLKLVDRQAVSTHGQFIPATLRFVC